MKKDHLHPAGLLHAFTLITLAKVSNSSGRSEVSLVIFIWMLWVLLTGVNGSVPCEQWPRVRRVKDAPCRGHMSELLGTHVTSQCCIWGKCRVTIVSTCFRHGFRHVYSCLVNVSHYWRGHQQKLYLHLKLAFINSTSTVPVHLL